MTALIDATIEWLANMDQGKLNAVVYIDLFCAKSACA
jgi:hypothetical protein